MSCIGPVTALFSSSVWMMVEFDSSNINTLESVTTTNSYSAVGMDTDDGKWANESSIHLVVDIFKENFHVGLPVKGTTFLIFTEEIAIIVFCAVGSGKFPVSKGLDGKEHIALENEGTR